jgi:hypothetical protein
MNRSARNLLFLFFFLIPGDAKSAVAPLAGGMPLDALGIY